MKLLYSDPKKRKLQRVEFALISVLLPLGLYFGTNAFIRWTKFSHAEELARQADVLSHEGRSKESSEALERAVEIYPEYVSAWQALAVSYHLRHNFMAAHDAYERAVEANPGNGDLYRDLATSYHYIGKHDEELEAAKKAIVLPTSDPLFTHRVYDRALREASGEIPKEKLIIDNASLVRAIELGSVPEYTHHDHQPE